DSKARPPLPSSDIFLGRSAGDAVADTDRAARDHLAIDAAVRVAVALHQDARDLQIADAGVRVDLGRGAAHDPLDDFQPYILTDVDLRADKVELAPGRPALDIKVAAKAERMHRRAGGIFKVRD